MKTIEVTLTVTPEGILKIHPSINQPTNLEPGDYSGLIVVEEQAASVQPKPKKKQPLEFPSYPIGSISPDSTFRREDMYGDDGR